MSYKSYFDLLDVRDIELRRSLVELMLETKGKHGFAWSDLELQHYGNEGKTAKKYLTTDFLLQGDTLNPRSIRSVIALLEKLSLNEQAVLDFHALRLHEIEQQKEQKKREAHEGYPVINNTFNGSTFNGGNFGTVANAEGANFGASVSGENNKQSKK